MAKVSFRRGLRANLPAAYTDGAFYIATDEKAVYIDSTNSRIRVADFQEYASLAALSQNPNPNGSTLYYVSNQNCLAKWDGVGYVLINQDTGMNSVEVIGDGNAVTVALYDSASRKLTLTKGASYVTGPEVDIKIEEALEDLTDYTVSVTASSNSGVAKRYTITQVGTGLSANIDIPKDMVVTSGAVVTKVNPGPWGQPGTYLALTIANAASDQLYINVTSLIEYVTSGSQPGDAVMISVSNDHKVTATISDGTITLAKLAQPVQTKIDKMQAIIDYNVMVGNIVDPFAEVT